MGRWLKPDLYVASLLAIPLEELVARGICSLIIDMDNTVTEWRSSSLRPDVRQWFATCRARGVQACLVSNNREGRVGYLAAQLDVPYVSNAAKPRRRAFRQAMRLLSSDIRQTAVVGDQVFTDVLGGNRLGLFTILVAPLSNREFIGTQLVRRVERIALRWMGLREGSTWGNR